MIQLAEADIANQARLTAAQLAKQAQTGAKGAAENFNRFVEGQGSDGTGYRKAPIDESKKDFWDSFGKPDDSGPSAIGTAAMKKKKEGDDWEKW